MSELPLYRIARWNDTYENNRSRKIEDLRWVPIPNSHDGEKYTELIMREDGPELFAAWILILQVASRCVDRGTLMRSNGHPHDSASLAMKTRAPEKIFAVALPYLRSIGWLVAEVSEQTELTLERQASAPQTSPERQAGDEEGNRREWKEENRIEGTHMGCSVGGQSGPAKDATMLRIEALFRRRASTPWDASELRALKANRAAVEAMDEKDWALLEWWFKQPAEGLYRRKDMGTLLNNWNAEVLRARDYKAKNADPDHNRPWLEGTGLE